MFKTYSLDSIHLALITVYLKSSYQSWGLPGWHQRPPGLQAPYLLQVAGMRIGETQPPTEATGPAAHNARTHHLVDSAVLMEQRVGGSGEKREDTSTWVQHVCNKDTKTCLNEADLSWSTRGSKSGVCLWGINKFGLCLLPSCVFMLILLLLLY